MAASEFFQAKSGAVESPSQQKITPNQQEITKGKDHEALANCFHRSSLSPFSWFFSGCFR
jgi:hypothetical protein